MRTHANAPRHAALAAALAALALAPRSPAQSALRIAGREGRAGARDFRPRGPGEELSVRVTPSGTIAAQRAGVGPRCLGWVSQQPDFVLRLRSPASALLLNVAGQGQDTTLLVNDAEGRWHCDDDSGEGFDPRLLIADAGVGQYDIWVGRYSRDARPAEADLRVATTSYVQVGAQSGVLGARELRPDFDPPTADVPIPAHPPGPHDGALAGLGCNGRLREVPDLVLRVPEGLPFLRLWATTAGDSTLVVHRPDGQWACESGEGGGGPSVSLTDVPRGQYDVWVGSRTGAEVSGALHVSRLTAVEVGGSTATHGVRELGPSFAPDPTVVEIPVHPPGDVRARHVQRYCAGQVTRAPDVIVRLPSEIPFLRMYALSEQDTTLLVHTPDDRWSCVDDSWGSDNPSVEMRAPAGQYEVWVGAFGNVPIGARLHFTRNRDLHPTPTPRAPPSPPAAPATAPAPAPAPTTAPPPATR